MKNIKKFIKNITLGDIIIGGGGLAIILYLVFTLAVRQINYEKHMTNQEAQITQIKENISDVVKITRVDANEMVYDIEEDTDLYLVTSKDAVYHVSIDKVQGNDSSLHSEIREISLSLNEK